MSADQVRKPPMERPHVERAEDLLNRIGQRFTQSRARFSQALEQRAVRASENGAAPASRPATERAEDLLDRAGERVGAFASNAGYQLRRWIARTREETEDILAEARNVSQRNNTATGSSDPRDDIKASTRTVKPRTTPAKKPGEKAPSQAAPATAAGSKRATPAKASQRNTGAATRAAKPRQDR